MPRGRAPLVLLSAVAIAALASLSAPAHDAVAAPPAKHAPTLDDYRHFRALSIDVLGRMPTREEIGQMERSGFDLDSWIDHHLDGPAYADRLTRVYMDALRLEPGPAVQHQSDATTLYRVQVQGPDKKPEWIYWRFRQRRAREPIDGEFCFTAEESGLEVDPNRPPKGEAKPISKELLEQRTVLVRPWWLYQDYRHEAPKVRLGEGARMPPSYQPVDGLLKDPDGKPTEVVRVCREEASIADSAPVVLTNRKPPPKDAPLPPGRRRPLPLDTGPAKERAGQTVSCRSRFAAENVAACGCGHALEHCLPSDANQNGGSFTFPNHMALGLDRPFDAARQGTNRTFPLWWSEEAKQIFGRLFREDRDFREVVTGRWTMVNGPLAMFYRSIAPGSCCGPETAFGMIQETAPLFSADAVPPDLLAYETDTWRVVNDRGPRAAGILTTPIFLEKYASPRARAAAIYQAFSCKSFVADNAQLMPSTEPDLTKRAGCKTCHSTLEPLAAYFARIPQGSSVFLPPATFPAVSPACKKDAKGNVPGRCNAFYDPAFADATHGTLRFAYASVEHADGGAAKAAADLVASTDFAACVVSRVAGSFLGRPLGPDDAALEKRLEATFVESGYRTRPLVRAILGADAYRHANNTRTGAPEAP